MNVEQVWKLVEQGKNVYWVNKSYKVFIEPVRAGVKIQEEHHTRKGDNLLSIRCISNHFGSIMGENELNNLFVDENI